MLFLFLTDDNDRLIAWVVVPCTLVILEGTLVDQKIAPCSAYVEEATMVEDQPNIRYCRHHPAPRTAPRLMAMMHRAG